MLVYIFSDAPKQRNRYFDVTSFVLTLFRIYPPLGRGESYVKVKSHRGPGRRCITRAGATFGRAKVSTMCRCRRVMSSDGTGWEFQ